MDQIQTYMDIFQRLQGSSRHQLKRTIQQRRMGLLCSSIQVDSHLYKAQLASWFKICLAHRLVPEQEVYQTYYRIYKTRDGRKIHFHHL